MSNKDNPIIPKINLFIYCLCIFVGSFFATICIGMFLTLQETILSARGILTPGDWATELTVEEGDLLIGLLKTGAILTQDQFIDNLNVIYSNVIQLLIALMGLVGFIGFLYVRKMSNDEFEVMFSQKSKDFLRNPDIINQIQKIADTRVEGYFDDYAAKSDTSELSELNDEITELKKQIHAMSQKLATIDNPDDDNQTNSTLEQK